MSTAVSVSGLHFHFGAREVLRNLSLEVRSGSRHALLGPNGSGKTTLFRILATLLRQDEGKVEVFGLALPKHAHQARAQMGVVFQQVALDGELTLIENLRIQGALQGLSRETLKLRIGQLLEQFGLTDRANSTVNTLSGGLKRRADLVRVLLHAPTLLLLDEPTVALDPAARAQFWQSLHHVQAESGCTILIATHLLDEAEEANSVSIMHQGQIVVSGEPTALMQEMGNLALWVETEDRDTLVAWAKERSLVPTWVEDRLWRVDGNHLADHLPSLSREVNLIEATLRRPTLLDVYMRATGHRWADEHA